MSYDQTFRKKKNIYMNNVSIVIRGRRLCSLIVIFCLVLLRESKSKVMFESSILIMHFLEYILTIYQ